MTLTATIDGINVSSIYIPTLSTFDNKTQYVRPRIMSSGTFYG